MTGFPPCLGAKAAMELSYVLITPYSIRGGIVSRVLSRSDLELAAAPDDCIPYPAGEYVEKTLVLIRPDTFRFPNARLVE
jgi:hypothetical protein